MYSLAEPREVDVALSVKSGENIVATRLKIERQGSVREARGRRSPLPRRRGTPWCRGSGCVGDLAVGEAEAVQHREAVEPVADPLVPGLQLGRRRAHQRAGQPAGHVPLNGKALDRGLLLLALKPEAVVGRGNLRECGSHGRELYRLFWTNARAASYPHLLHRARAARMGRALHAVRAEGARRRSRSGNFWTLQHAQLYSEPERLAAAGYVTEEREEGGRGAGATGSPTKGRRALRRWRGEPTGELTELRDPGLLKLFFGADPASSAPASSRPTARSWPSTRLPLFSPGWPAKGAWDRLPARSKMPCFTAASFDRRLHRVEQILRLADGSALRARRNWFVRSRGRSRGWRPAITR